jgi:putative lipoprotein
MTRALAFALLALCLALPAARAELVTLRGEIDWPDDLSVPRGAALEVTLERLSGGAEPLASQRLLPVAAPEPFSLVYDDRLTPAGGAYRLSARLSAEGRTIREARRPVTLDPGRDGRIALRLGEVRGPGGPGALLDAPWTAVELRGETPPDFARATLVFERDGSVRGSTGCNALEGPVHLGAETVDFGPLSTSRRGCQPEVMRLERRFLGALREASGWTLEEGELRLLDDRGRIVARLRRDP